MVDASVDGRVGPAELVRLAAVARRFYLEGRSKLEIAEEFGVSRFKIARLLDQALASGIVRIEVGVPAQIDAELSGALLGVNVQENSIELVRRVAAVSGGPAFPIYTPQVLPDFATAEALRRQPQVAEAQRRWNQLTKAVVAVGSWDPPHSQLYIALSQRERDQLRAQGACAELCANLLDADGRPVATDFTDRCITITVGQLRTVDEVIAVGGGHDKIAAFRAILKGGYATSLITDVIVARALLDQPPPPGAPPRPA